MINVIVVDDHPLVREGLKKILTNETLGIEVVAEASNAIDLMEKLETIVPDVVILDISMPGKTGLDIIKDLKQTHPNLPILILSMHPEERFAVRVLKAGASGYINKNSVNEELTKAIRVVVTEKRRFISQAVGDQLADFVLSDEHPTLHESLSDREYQVLCMIATGKKIGAIAEELSLSAQTIHTYRARLKEKMNMKSNAEMIRYAIDQNLVD